MSRRSIGAFLGVFAVIAAVAAVDLNMPPMSARSAGSDMDQAVPLDDEATAGAWVCVMGEALQGGSGTFTVSRPPTPSRTASRWDLLFQASGQERSVEAGDLRPGEVTRTPLPVAPDTAGVLRWSGAPVALHREWITEAADDVPPGIVSGSCPSVTAERWTIPGITTAGGAQARVRIANPFETDATVAVRFVAPEGPEDPIALQNVSVASKSAFEITVNEVLPEREDLTVIVEVRAGRVAVEGVQIVRSAIGGVDGLSLLSANAAASESWVLGWVADDPEHSSWLWAFNPGDRAATLEMTYSSPDGGIVAQGLDEVDIPPGGLRRVDLRGTLPEDVDSAALVVRSEGNPVFVSVATEVRADETERTSFVVQPGAAATDSSWVVTGGPAEGRDESVILVNPGSDEVEVEVLVEFGDGSPRPFREAVVAPGAVLTLPLPSADAAAPGWTAFVQATGDGIVAARHGSASQGPLRLVVEPGVSAAAWRAVGVGLGNRHERGLVQRLRTSLGIEPIDEFSPQNADGQG